MKPETAVFGLNWGIYPHIFACRIISLRNFDD